MLFEMYKNFFYDANTRRHFFIAAQEYRASNSKGQLISKCLFSVFNSPKKQTWKFEFLPLPNGADIFRSFFGRIEKTQKPFRN